MTMFLKASSRVVDLMWLKTVSTLPSDAVIRRIGTTMLCHVLVCFLFCFFLHGTVLQHHSF